MRRFCFLLPNVESAHGVVGDLRGAHIPDKDIFVIANERTDLGDLPAASTVEKSDFYPQLKRGLALGGVIGTIGGLVAMRLAGAVFGGGAVVLFGLVGAGINGLLAAIAGAAFPDSRLRQFEDAVEAGHVLVLVDVPPDKLEAVEASIRARHPEIEIETLEPRTPIVPHP
jgi:hypothetical protein